MSEDLLAAMQQQLQHVSRLMEGNLRVQHTEKMEQAEKETKAARIAEADKAESARKAQLESSATMARALKDHGSKSKLGWAVSICGLNNAGDRAVVTKSVVEATQMLEERTGDLEEANGLLEAATRKTTLGKEEQEELYKSIKIRKHAVMSGAAATASGMVCERCHRIGSHITADCAANTTAAGGPCLTPMTAEAQTKYQRKRGGGAGGLGGFGYAGPRETPTMYAAALPAGPAAFFPPAAPPMMQQPQYGGGPGFAGGGGGFVPFGDSASATTFLSPGA